MQKNLTLTVDEDLLLSARKIALERRTSVNRMVRDYLADLVGESAKWRAAAKEFTELAKKSSARVGNGAWTRDELHERR